MIDVFKVLQIEPQFSYRQVCKWIATGDDHVSNLPMIPDVFDHPLIVCADSFPSSTG